MNPRYLDCLVSLQTHQPLVLDGSRLITSDQSESYDVVKDIPVMLGSETVPAWHRELMEVILWQYPDEIEKMYKEIDYKIPPVEVYVKHIKRLLHDKQSIVSALEQYASSETQQWVVRKTDSGNISKSQMKELRKYAKKRNGKRRVATKKKAEGSFKPYPIFAREAFIGNPKIVVELATGAGGGTSAVALNKPDDCILFTVDIGFACLGNAIGIAKFLKQRETLLPVCANFWFMPFADSSVDTVCTNYGLDESRENERTISEVSRILKNGGRFVCTSRNDAFMRQYNVLEPFGFTRDETVALLQKCRLYSNADNLIDCCKKYGMKLVNKEEFVMDETKTVVITSFVKEQ